MDTRITQMTSKKDKVQSSSKYQRMIENLMNDYWNPEEFQTKLDRLKAQKQNPQVQLNQ